MAASSAVPDGDLSGGQPSVRRAVRTALTVLAFAAQAFVLLVTFLMGLGWGGFTYLAALMQAGAAFVPLTRLATRRRKAVLLVPVLSAALTGGLLIGGQAYDRATACSEQELAAAQQLAPPPGTTVELEGEYPEGCVARTRTRLTNQDIVQHYRAEFARRGWQETPGQHDSTIGIAAVKDGIHVVVEVYSGQEAEAQMLEVVAGDPTGTSPCSLYTVDGYLERRPTTGVEPGEWMVLASTDDGPASVVVRDSTAAVVLERQAHPRPDDFDDMEQIDALPGGVPGLSLDEGNYQIECRHGGGGVTTAALSVAWAQDSQEKTVAVRVFDTPDHWK